MLLINLIYKWIQHLEREWRTIIGCFLNKWNASWSSPHVRMIYAASTFCLSCFTSWRWAACSIERRKSACCSPLVHNPRPRIALTHSVLPPIVPHEHLNRPGRGLGSVGRSRCIIWTQPCFFCEQLMAWMGAISQPLQSIMHFLPHPQV